MGGMVGKVRMGRMGIWSVCGTDTDVPPTVPYDDAGPLVEVDGETGEKDNGTGHQPAIDFASVNDPDDGWERTDLQP